MRNMATGNSGTIVGAKTGYFGVEIDWSETYDLVSNLSTVVSKVYITYYSIAISGATRAHCTMDGITQDAYVSGISHYPNTNTRRLVATFTQSNIAHNADGSRALDISASFNFWLQSQEYGYVNTLSASKTVQLYTIPRKSQLTATDGTLGTAQTLTVTKQASAFTHTITYTCGSASGTVCTKASSASISWTPPLELAKQNTKGDSVSVTLTIETFNGSTSVGTSQTAISCAIPDSVKPSISVTLSDAMGYAATFGGYVQGMSKLRIAVTGAGAQGSSISSYRITADGKTYTGKDVTTNVLSGTGTLTVRAVVTDSRGRTAEKTQNITVLAYAAPTIKALRAYRSDAKGAAASAGAYLAVEFTAQITSLNSRNAANYTVACKKTSEGSYGNAAAVSAYTGNYNPVNGLYVFQADTDSSYDILLSAADSFKSVSATAVGFSVAKLMSFLKSNNGMAFGKVADTEDCLDIAWSKLKVGGLLQGVAEEGTSGIWTYRKWANGIAECWCHQAEGSIYFSTKAATGMCVSGARTWTYPFPFTAVHSVNVNIVSDRTCGCSIQSIGETSAQGTLWCATDNQIVTVSNAVIYCAVVGTWK